MRGNRTFTSSKSERADRFSQLVYPVRKKDITLQIILSVCTDRFRYVFPLPLLKISFDPLFLHLHKFHSP